MKKQSFLVTLQFFVGYVVGFTLLDAILWKMPFNYDNLLRNIISSLIISIVLGVIHYFIFKANNNK
ncbi:hypothetical protein [Capnocytophaga sp. HP1101]